LLPQTARQPRHEGAPSVSVLRDAQQSASCCCYGSRQLRVRRRQEVPTTPRVVCSARVAGRQTGRQACKRVAGWVGRWGGMQERWLCARCTKVACDRRQEGMERRGMRHGVCGAHKERRRVLRVPRVKCGNFLGVVVWWCACVCCGGCMCVCVWQCVGAVCGGGRRGVWWGKVLCGVVV